MHIGVFTSHSETNAIVRVPTAPETPQYWHTHLTMPCYLLATLLIPNFFVV
jgi:hypothetical protein